VVEGEGGGWQNGTFWVNRTEYARKPNGTVRKLRTFNSRTGDYKWFPAGRDYYTHNRQSFIINVPCLGYIPEMKTRNGMEMALMGVFGRAARRNEAAEEGNIDEDGSEEDEPLLRSTFYGNGHTYRVVPLTTDGLASFSPNAEVASAFQPWV